MRTGIFIWILALIAALGISVLFWQRSEIQKEEGRVSPSSTPIPEKLRPIRREAQPQVSLELLRLRNEVTMLNKELAENTKAGADGPDPLLQKRAASAWAEIHSGPKLSEQPGFVSVTNLMEAGNATPGHAFQNLQFAVRNQQHEPLTPARMKEIWDLPDDFDDPSARYSVSLGKGIGGETGYRIAREQFLSDNEVKLTVDFETTQGGLVRQDHTLVYRNGKWRVKPDGVKAEP